MGRALQGVPEPYSPDQVIAVWDLDSIDRELRDIRRMIRDEPMTSENKRALQARTDVLLDRRLMLMARLDEHTMIEG